MPDLTPSRALVPTIDPNDPPLIQVCRQIVAEHTARYVTGADGSRARVLTQAELSAMEGATDEDADDLPEGDGLDAQHPLNSPAGVTLFDAQTAHAVCLVYDAINAENKGRWMTMHPARIGRTAWTIIGKQKET